MMAQEPIVAEWGWVRITDSTNFPAATTIAAALVNIEPGYVENTGSDVLQFLEVFRASRYEEVSLADS